MNVQRQIGIFQFNRVGIGYSGGLLRFAIDASMALGPFALSMDGLSISSPLTHFEPKFSLDGLGLECSQAPLEITGTLLRLPSIELAKGTKFQFEGMVVIKAEEISLAAIGSYAELESGDPSLFIFAQLSDPLGGPPPFFVTGLMAGFGFNRGLAIPGQDEVVDFPLLMLADPPQPGGKAEKQDPMHVLAILEGRTAIKGTPRKWIEPQPGEYWIAAGILFTSFKLVDSKALLIVDFGNDLQIVLLGLSKNAPAAAHR